MANSTRTRRKSTAPPKADPEFDAEGTLQRLTELLMQDPEGRSAETVAFTHMGAHGSAESRDGDMRCKRIPCKLLGTAFAYAEIRGWLDWTTNETPQVALGLAASDMAKTVTQHAFLTELRKYLHQNYSRFHPSKTESKHMTVADHDATCVAPALVLSCTAQLVRSIESFVETLHVPPAIVSGKTGEPGRPKQVLFSAVAQHLFAGGHTYAGTAKLLGCSVERARNAIRTEDARWYLTETGVRRLPGPRN